jgi:hypothetical protein
MKTIAQHIISKLTTDYHVVIPNLGIIAAFPKKSIISPLGEITPPSYDIMFTKEKSVYDHSLAADLSKMQNVSLLEAAKQIKHFVDEINTELIINGKYEVDGLGSFIINQKGITEFEAKRIDFQDFYGFHGIRIKPINRNISQSEDISEIDVKIKSHLQKTLMRAAVIIPGILIGSYALFTQQKSNLETISMFLNPFETHEIIHYTPRIPFNEKNIKKSTVSIYEEEWQALISKVEIVENKKIIEENQNKSISGQFHLIAGCFSMKENAEKWILELKNEHAEVSIIEHDNMFAVSIKTSNNKEELKQIAEMYQNKFPGIWIKKI